MRRFVRWDKKYLYWGLTAFVVIAASIVFYMLLKYIPVIGQFLSKLTKILSPFIWGLGITYLIAPLMRKLEKKIPKALAVIICIVTLLAVLTALIYLIIPQLYSSVETIVANSPAYAEKAGTWLEDRFSKYPEIETYIEDKFDQFSDGIIDILKNQVLPSLGNVVTNVTTGVYYVLKGIYNLVIGIIVSAYVLPNLDKFLAGCRRILYAVFSIEAAEEIRKGFRFVDKTFMGFITGKLLDSAIIGLICYIFCALVGMPYALLVSVIVGVTNIIPFFGPFIGAIPSALIILLVSPVKCLIFIVFIIILQQLDGNFIGPKILGNSIGINGFWVMFSIIIGAGFFGFWGMLLGVPVFVCIYALIERRLSRKLERSDLPKEAASYENLDSINPVTREVSYK